MLQETNIRLNTVEDVINFVSITENISQPVSICSSSFNGIIDGKSLLGLLSINLLEPLKVFSSLYKDSDLNLFRKISSFAIAE